MDQKINTVLENFSLEQLNTFGMNVRAGYFFPFNCFASLSEVLGSDRYSGLPRLILGGGSNILFTKDFEGLVLHPLFKGIDLVSEDADNYHIRVAGGENWDNFVSYAVSRNWCGIENLSGIPGNVGASPVQNIGAYGTEVKDFITEVESIDLKSFHVRKLTNADCMFGYRDSIFKNELKGSHLITHVTFRLKKRMDFNLCYGEIEKEVKQKEKITLISIREAVMRIRASKLPDPRVTGNAGSFFKNPVISSEVLGKILLDYPDAPRYKITGTEFKVPAGWLIEMCGWKGRKEGNAGVHDKQALVLVNNGNATGKEILNLSDKIIRSVHEKFHIILNTEVNII